MRMTPLLRHYRQYISALRAADDWAERNGTAANIALGALCAACCLEVFMGCFG